LRKFADSSVSPQACVVDFSDNCSGKDDELDDIEDNRDKYRILSSSLGTPRINSIARHQRAEVSLSCSFESRVIRCEPGETDCTVGEVSRVRGTCRLTAVYQQARWWLCESRFSSSSGLTPSMMRFFGIDGARSSSDFP
jgi:hypothetical protein